MKKMVFLSIVFFVICLGLTAARPALAAEAQIYPALAPEKETYKLGDKIIVQPAGEDKNKPTLYEFYFSNDKGQSEKKKCATVPVNLGCTKQQIPSSLIIPGATVTYYLKAYTGASFLGYSLLLETEHKTFKVDEVNIDLEISPLKDIYEAGDKIIVQPAGEDKNKPTLYEFYFSNDKGQSEKKKCATVPVNLGCTKQQIPSSLIIPGATVTYYLKAYTGSSFLGYSLLLETEHKISPVKKIVIDSEILPTKDVYGFNEEVKVKPAGEDKNKPVISFFEFIFSNDQGGKVVQQCANVLNPCIRKIPTNLLAPGSTVNYQIKAYSGYGASVSLLDESESKSFKVEEVELYSDISPVKDVYELGDKVVVQPAGEDKNKPTFYEFYFSNDKGQSEKKKCYTAFSNFACLKQTIPGSLLFPGSTVTYYFKAFIPAGAPAYGYSLLLETEHKTFKVDEVDIDIELTPAKEIYQAGEKVIAKPSGEDKNKPTLYEFYFSNDKGKKIVKKCSTVPLNFGCAIPLPDSILVPGSTITYYLKAYTGVSLPPYGYHLLLETEHKTFKIANVVLELEANSDKDEKGTAYANETVGFKINVVEGQAKKINIVVEKNSGKADFVIMKTCKAAGVNGLVKECAYTGGPYLGHAGKELHFKAGAYDKYGKLHETYVKTVKILPPKQIKVDIATDKDDAGEAVAGEAINFIAKTVEDGPLPQSLVIFVNNVIAKICKNVISCAFTSASGAYAKYAGKSITYGAIALDKTANLQSMILQGGSTGIKSLKIIALGVEISNNQGAEMLETEGVLFTAKVKGGQKVPKLEIWVNAKKAAECLDASTCSYAGGPYSSETYSEVTYSATVYDKNGNPVTTGYQWIKILPDDELPNIVMNASDNNINNQEQVVFTASIDHSPKQVKALELYLSPYKPAGNEINIYVCDDWPCSYTAGPYAAGEGIFNLPGAGYPLVAQYYAKAIFSDGTSQMSKIKYLLIAEVKKESEKASIDIWVSKSPVIQTEQVVYTAKVNLGTLAVGKLEMFVDNKEVKECASAVCEFNGGPYSLYSGKSARNVPYYAKVVLSDGRVLTTKVKTLYVEKDRMPPIVKISGELGSQGDYKITASVDEESGNIAKTNIYLESAEEYLLNNRLEGSIMSDRSDIVANQNYIVKSCLGERVCIVEGKNLEIGKSYVYFAEAFDESGNRGVSETKYFEIRSESASGGSSSGSSNGGNRSDTETGSSGGSSGDSTRVDTGTGGSTGSGGSGSSGSSSDSSGDSTRGSTGTGTDSSSGGSRTGTDSGGSSGGSRSR